MTERSTYTPYDAVVGTILHARGTLRLFQNRHGRLYAEVIGFDCPDGHAFLSELGGQLEDITSDILVCDDPAGYGAPPLAPMRHRRRGA